MSDKPHKRIPIISKTCSFCGKRLNLRKKIFIDSKQEIDIPAVEAIISQFDKYQISYSCGHVSNGKFPDRLKVKIQYGARTKALVAWRSYENTVADLEFPMKLGERINGILKYEFDLKDNLKHFNIYR